jgi:multiple RNA-binding domain-containing protein 1
MDLDDQHSKPRSDAQDPPQVENTAKKENTPEEEKNTTEEEKILKHRRLYVRNLPFDVLEDDLRDHFSAFGELEEVRLSSLHTPFRDEP